MQTGNVVSVRNWLYKKHSIEAIKQNVTFGRNNLTRDKLHRYLCYKLYFLALIILIILLYINCMENNYN